MIRYFCRCLLVCGLLPSLGWTLEARYEWINDRPASETRLYYSDKTHQYRVGYANSEVISGYYDGCLSRTRGVRRAHYQWRIQKQQQVGAHPAMTRWVDVWTSARTRACRLMVTGPTEAVGTVLRRRQQLTFRPEDRLTVGTAQHFGRWWVDAGPVHDISEDRLPRQETIIGPAFPRNGLYRVELTVSNQQHTDSDTFTADMQHKDVLIALIGDSYSSGEGNPDKAGTVKPLWPNGGDERCKATKLVHLVQDDPLELLQWLPGRGTLYDPVQETEDSKRYRMPMSVDPVWLDLAAHRSAKSGQALAVKDFERYAIEHYGWSTTFVNFATSGATTENLLRRAQLFFQWQRFDATQSCITCGQLHELQAAVGERVIDVLMISIGGNDVGFTDLLAKALTDDLIEADLTKFEEGLTALGDAYKEIDTTARELIKARKILLTGYPVDLFVKTNGETGKGCGFFSSNVFSGIGLGDAELLKSMGEKLLAKQREVAMQLNWEFVDVSPSFDGHGYCTKHMSYLRSAERSCEEQGDISGAMHPNEEGLAVYRTRTLAALKKLFEPPTPQPIGRLPWRMSHDR